MKKRKPFMKEKTANELLAILFLITSFIALKYSQRSIASNVLGICFMISAVYGGVCVLKNKKFLF